MTGNVANLLVKSLPKSGISWACFYGSTLMEQKSSSSSQLDVLIIVKDNELKKWHEENMKLNSRHYSNLSKLFGIR
jgi:hypothetical protein